VDREEFSRTEFLFSVIALESTLYQFWNVFHLPILHCLAMIVAFSRRRLQDLDLKHLSNSITAVYRSYPYVPPDSLHAYRAENMSVLRARDAPVFPIRTAVMPSRMSQHRTCHSSCKHDFDQQAASKFQRHPQGRECVVPESVACSQLYFHRATKTFSKHSARFHFP
jgi:hypothetical protein